MSPPPLPQWMKYAEGRTPLLADEVKRQEGKAALDVNYRGSTFSERLAEVDRLMASPTSWQCKNLDSYLRSVMTGAICIGS